MGPVVGIVWLKRNSLDPLLDKHRIIVAVEKEKGESPWDLFRSAGCLSSVHLLSPVRTKSSDTRHVKDCLNREST